MPFINDMHSHHLSIFEMLDGREVIYAPDGGSPRALSAMLQEYSEIYGGESVDIISSKPVLSARTADIPEIQTGDVFEIDGASYEAQAIRPDSEGITELTLEKL
jgi:glutamate dehydrogenase/leucine dehydrogenase